MRLRLVQIDAFTDTVFSGNPAAVCPLEGWLPDETLLAIAAENNLSETAFIVPTDDGVWNLRWFTPAVEVQLCGHATLAAAWFLLNAAPSRNAVHFDTRSGRLSVSREEDGALTMDFPSLPPFPITPPEGLADALGAAPQQVLGIKSVHNAHYYLATFSTPEAIRSIHPDFRALLEDFQANVIVTAPADDPAVDFVSRFFAPASGVPEDPVTGSAHCSLAPYWSKRLGKPRLRARQISTRGGELICEVQGDRVRLTGRCVQYLDGWIQLP